MASGDPHARPWASMLESTDSVRPSPSRVWRSAGTDSPVWASSCAIPWSKASAPTELRIWSTRSLDPGVADRQGVGERGAGRAGPRCPSPRPPSTSAPGTPSPRTRTSRAPPSKRSDIAAPLKSPKYFSSWARPWLSGSSGASDIGCRRCPGHAVEHLVDGPGRDVAGDEPLTADVVDTALEVVVVREAARRGGVDERLRGVVVVREDHPAVGEGDAGVLRLLEVTGRPSAPAPQASQLLEPLLRRVLVLDRDRDGKLRRVLVVPARSSPRSCPATGRCRPRS